MRPVRWALACGALLGRPAPGHAQDAAPVVEASGSLRALLEPEGARRGTLARVVLGFENAGDPALTPQVVAASLAGEPLHFRPDSTGALTALAGIPVEGGATEALTLILARGSVRDTVRYDLDVAPGAFRSERLTVPPRMAQPDSADAARLAREREQARLVGAASHTRPPLHRAWRRPRPGRVTSPFGTARVYNGTVASRHLGTDYAGAPGAPVHAAADGIVALADTFLLAGRLVYVDHGGGLVSGYFHLSRIDVQPGDTVRAGQRLGAVGATGRVTGPHLHWVLRYGGVSVDGGEWLGRRDGGRD